MSEFQQVASRAIRLLDLTNLNDNCSEADIDRLAAQGLTPYGKVAALCVWPKWIRRAIAGVSGTGIRVASVTNFPSGRATPDTAARETAEAFSAGADEVDMVLDYRAILAGDAGLAARQVEAARRVVPHGHVLKVIIESGVLSTRGHILVASQVALDCGADFIKTSTGKANTNATPEAAAIMLGAIRRGGYSAGFKAAGGIKGTLDAAIYFDIADQLMGNDWISPSTFRFGASGALADFLATIDGRIPVPSSGY